VAARRHTKLPSDYIGSPKRGIPRPEGEGPMMFVDDVLDDVLDDFLALQRGML